MTLSPTSAAAVPQMAARITIAAGAVSVAALASLHALRSELDPSWHMISEYAVGTYGWVMTVSFAAFAAASAALVVALWARLKTLQGRIGLAFLLASAAGLGLAAAFPMDPLSTPPEAASFSGKMHGVSAMIGIPGEILAVLLLSLALRKQGHSGVLTLLAAVIWISLVVMIAALMVAMQAQTMEGPGVLGWANRALMVAYSLWLIVAARPLAAPRPVVPH